MTDIEVKEETTKSKPLLEMTHDTFFKRSVAKKQTAIELLEFWISKINKDLLKEINLATIELVRCDFADKTLGKGISDTLYSVEWNKKRGYIFVLIEHVRHEVARLKSILKMARLYSNLSCHYLGAFSVTKRC